MLFHRDHGETVSVHGEFHVVPGEGQAVYPLGVLHKGIYYLTIYYLLYGLHCGDLLFDNLVFGLRCGKGNKPTHTPELLRVSNSK